MANGNIILRAPDHGDRDVHCVILPDGENFDVEDWCDGECMRSETMDREGVARCISTCIKNGWTIG